MRIIIYTVLTAGILFLLWCLMRSAAQASRSEEMRHGPDRDNMDRCDKKPIGKE